MNGSDSADITNLTVGDIENVANPVIRDAVMRVKHRLGSIQALGSTEHHNHTSHSDGKVHLTPEDLGLKPLENM